MDYDKVPVQEDALAEKSEVHVQVSAADARRVKHQMYRTVCIFVGYFVSGMFSGVYGPTLLQLERYLDTDTASIAWALTSLSLGYLIGAFLCGVVFDRVNHELYLGVSFGTYSLVFAMATFFGGLPAYIAMLGIFGFFQGLAYTAGQPYCLHLWDGSNAKKSIMQALYLSWSVGATVGPFLVQPFLVDLPSSSIAGINCTDSVPNFNTSSNGQHVYMALSSFTNTTPGNAYLTRSHEMLSDEYSSVDRKQQYGSVRYAYVTAGCIGLVAAVLFSVAFCITDPGCLLKKKRTSQKRLENETDELKHGTRVIVALHVFLFTVYFFFQLVEYTTFSLVAAFTVKQLCWENKYAALSTSVVYASHGVGRLVGVPTAAFLSARNMLIIDFVLLLVAYMLMLFVNYHYIIMWLSAALAGLSMGTMTACCLLHISLVLRITGMTSAIFMIASSVAGMSGPVLLGYMMDNYSPMWFVYILLTGAVLSIVTFIAMDIYSRYIEKGKGVY